MRPYLIGSLHTSKCDFELLKTELDMDAVGASSLNHEASQGGIAFGKGCIVSALRMETRNEWEESIDDRDKRERERERAASFHCHSTVHINIGR